MFEAIITYAFSVAAITGAIVYLAKNIFEHILTRNQNKFDSQLKLISEKSLEEIHKKNQLELTKFEIRFSALQPIRLKPFLDLYASLEVVMYCSQDIYTYVKHNIDNDFENDFQELFTKMSLSRKCLSQAALFLPQNLYQKIDNELDTISDASLKYDISINNGDTAIKAAKIASSVLKESYKVTLENIATSLRELLGVELSFSKSIAK